MTQDSLFLLAVAVVAFYLLRLALRLAPVTNEFSLKTAVAALLSIIVALAGVLPYQVGEPLRLTVLIIGPLFTFGPMLAVGLARIRRYRLASLLLKALYWTPEGREAPQRLVTQAALQKGDLGAALDLIPAGDALMLAQAHAQGGEWERILQLDLPRDGDNSFLGDAAIIEALIGLGRIDEARTALTQMRSRWEAGDQGPLGYRSLRLSEARLAAEDGNLAGVREVLGQPLPGVPAHQLLAVLARAAQQAQRPEDAIRLYGQAFAVAPEGLRGRYRERLTELGAEEPPQPLPAKWAVATFTLGGALVLAYLGQVWLDASTGPFTVWGTNWQASSIAAGFLLGVPPGIPEQDAWWRYLSYALLHGGILHIGFNVWVLVDIGRVYELRRNFANLLAAFVLGTAMGAYITAIAHGGGALVLLGASGGVLGVAGALLADAFTSRSPGDRMLRGSLLRWMAIIVLISVAIPNVSLWGHVGGVVGGLLWGFVRQGLPRSRGIDAFAAAAALAVFLVAAGQAVVLAIRLTNI